MSDISKAYISSLIPKGATILDVGSYNGKDAVELAQACDSDVHCFEPVNYDLISQRNNNRLEVWPYALTQQIGIAFMNVSTNHQQSNSIKAPKEHIKIFPQVVYDKWVKINCTTLDTWNLRVRNGAPIDFIWCDVNGSEFDFIKGGMKTLENTSYLYIEFCEKELFEGALNRKQLIDILDCFEPIGEYNFMGNYGNLLFKNKNL